MKNLGQIFPIQEFTMECIHIAVEYEERHKNGTNNEKLYRVLAL